MILGKLTNANFTKYGMLLLPLLVGLAIKDPLNTLYKKTFTSAAAQGPVEELLQKGLTLQSAGNNEQAIKLYHQALQTSPTVTPTLIRLGQSFANMGNHEQAIMYFKASLAIEPRHLQVYVALAMSLMATHDYEEVIKQCTNATKLSPTYFDAVLQLAKAESELKHFDSALLHVQKAISLQPKNIHAYLNLGHIHNKNGQLDAAIAAYQKALEIDPNFPNALYNLGYTLRIAKKPDEALPYLHRAEQLKENYTDAHIALAQAYWAKADYENAWKYYAKRLKLLGVDPTKMEIPLWDGSSLKGKKILLYAEQGLGDTLQFIRYGKMLKEQGAIITCKVQKPLVTLLSSVPYIDHIITTINNKDFDWQAPLLNIPGIVKTRANNIPAEIPYLHADSKLVQFWKNKLAHDTKFKVGLCWHVDPQHETDKSPWAKRSVNIELFTPLSSIANTSFYSLQKISGEDQLKNLPDSFNIHTFGPNFDEQHGRFMDTAAVIMNLDLIITVDTSIAHLAAAMGKKVWMLLPYSPDPRWYEEGNTTPWYPTMRLFRQPKPYDWNSVGKELVNALEKEVKHV